MVLRWKESHILINHLILNSRRHRGQTTCRVSVGPLVFFLDSRQGACHGLMTCCCYRLMVERIMKERGERMPTDYSTDLGLIFLMDMWHILLFNKEIKGHLKKGWIQNELASALKRYSTTEEGSEKSEKGSQSIKQILHCWFYQMLPCLCYFSGFAILQKVLALQDWGDLTLGRNWSL